MAGFDIAVTSPTAPAPRAGTAGTDRDADTTPLEGGDSCRARRRRLSQVQRIAGAVGLIYLFASVVIFRDVITAIPDVLSGKRVIVGDELVPFFNPESQLLEQAQGKYNELTNGYEFRVRYAFLTTWVRYYKILPFAVVLALPAIVWGAYVSTAWFVSRAFRQLDGATVYLAAALPTGLIYMIMIYAKITHFYTLVLGLMMMTVSAYLMLDALIFTAHKWGRRMVASCLVTLFNPAVHYLILFTLFLTLTTMTLLLGEFGRWLRATGPRRLIAWVRVPLRRRRKEAARFRASGRRTKLLRQRLARFGNTTTGRCFWAFTSLLGLAVIPYGIFVKFVALRGVPNLSETVPGDYYFIRDASVSFMHILSWDLAGIMDKVNFGDYLVKTPRVSNLVYMGLAMLPLLSPGLRGFLFRTRRHRQLLGVVYVNVAFAVWATVGYGEPKWFPTFHRTLAALTRTLYSTHSGPGDLTLSISSTIVQVLRFPHRFQLILFMLGPLLMTLPLAWGIGRVHRVVAPVAARWWSAFDARHGARLSEDAVRRRLLRRDSRRRRREQRPGGPLGARVAVTCALGLVFFTPFLSNSAYRHAYTTGDFDDFMSAYPVEHLEDLKSQLIKLPAGKTVVLPPTETSKLVIGSDGVPHKFIDKFYIYYLDQPSFYFGLTGDKDNKFEFFLLLRGLYYQQDWWVNVARDIGLEYIVLNKQVQDNRGVGAEYLPDLESYLREGLEAVPDHLETLYENDSFVLYRLDEPAPRNRETLLFDTSWQGYLDAVFDRLDLSRCYDFQYISSFEGTNPDNPTTLIATDPADAAVDVWALDHPEMFFVPSSKPFAFNSDIVASSYYLSPNFRLFLFFSTTKWNRTEMITPGIFGTLRGSFIGVPRSTQFTVPVVVPESGRYRVLMRGAATANVLRFTSPSLGLDQQLEMRSPPDALGLYDVEEIYRAGRVAVDVSSMTPEELESQIPEVLAPVNQRYVYHDVGVIDASAGPHKVIVDKIDENPMLVEGLLLIPEATDASLTLPDSVDLVTDVDELRCSQASVVRTGLSDSTDAVGNDAHADLTEDELYDLIGGERPDLDTEGGFGPRPAELAALVGLGVIAIGNVRHRRRLRQDEPGEPEEHNEHGDG